MKVQQLQAVCALCGSVEHLSRCSRCRSVCYCCKDHQREHWAVHKPMCVPVIETKPDTSLPASTATVITSHNSQSGNFLPLRSAGGLSSQGGGWEPSARNTTLGHVGKSSANQGEIPLTAVNFNLTQSTAEYPAYDPPPAVAADVVGAASGIGGVARLSLVDYPRLKTESSICLSASDKKVSGDNSDLTTPPSTSYTYVDWKPSKPVDDDESRGAISLKGLDSTLNDSLVSQTVTSSLSFTPYLSTSLFGADDDSLSLGGYLDQSQPSEPDSQISELSDYCGSPIVGHFSAAMPSMLNVLPEHDLNKWKTVLDDEDSTNNLLSSSIPPTSQTLAGKTHLDSDQYLTAPPPFRHSSIGAFGGSLTAPDPVTSYPSKSTNLSNLLWDPMRRHTAEWMLQVCQYVVRDLDLYGVCVVDNFLGKERGDAILAGVEGMYDSGCFREGEVVNGKRKTMKNVRGDKITWVDGTESDTGSIAYLISMVDSVIMHARKMKNNGKLGNHQISGRTKAMVACYPGSGTHYIKHVDNPNRDGRCITSIYYLNKDWDIKRDGGLLRIFPEGWTNQVADIEPIFDRMLFFWSDRRNPHEVQPAYRTRYAITLWYFDAKEREEARLRHQQSKRPYSSSESKSKVSKAQ